MSEANKTPANAEASHFPRRYWWVVAVVVPLATAALQLFSPKSGGTSPSSANTTYGDQSPVVEPHDSSGVVNITYGR